MDDNTNPDTVMETLLGTALVIVLCPLVLLAITAMGLLWLRWTIWLVTVIL